MLSRKELMQGFQNVFGEEIAKKKVDSMFSQFDKDGTGFINYNSKWYM